jgi:hypothetical protein
VSQCGGRVPRHKATGELVRVKRQKKEWVQNKVKVKRQSKEFRATQIIYENSIFSQMHTAIKNLLATDGESYTYKSLKFIGIHFLLFTFHFFFRYCRVLLP